MEMNINEFEALISLLEDPDRDIYQQIKHKLVSSGPEAIPLLEESWEKSFDPLQQSRIEQVIHTIQFDQVKSDLQIWKLSNQNNLLEALLILSRYQYPTLDEQYVLNTLSELRRDCWFGLFYEMTPIEKVKLLNNIIFRDFGLSGNTSNYHDPQNSYIHRVLETKKGNPISLACIYSLIAQKLDIPIYGVNLPRHFVLAYMNEDESNVLFYINVFNRGQIMQRNDIESFLKQLNLPMAEEFTLPCSHLSIIKRVIRNLITSYGHLDKKRKKNEMKKLLYLIDD